MPLLETKGAASAQGFGLTLNTIVANYIEDVFSTYLYTGNGATQTIINGINLSGKGGLVWLKQRTATPAATSHIWLDTVRGASNTLCSDSTGAQNAVAGASNTFNTDGFGLLSTGANSNGSGSTYGSWTFREQPKFFDIVTYTGNGTSQNITHNLGSVPGCIIVKNLAAGSWYVYHRSTGNTGELRLNVTDALATSATDWNSTNPTSAVFSVGASAGTNSNGASFVAYLFAHDAGGFGLTGSDNVISCGSYEATGSGAVTINLGYEPQWVMVKRAVRTGGALDDIPDSWSIFDDMRGITANGNAENLRANLQDAEITVATPSFTATGMSMAGNYNTLSGGSAATYIYVAIRRGPMKVPTSGTSVFEPIARAGTGSATTQATTLNGTDMAFTIPRDAAGNNWMLVDRLRGKTALIQPNTTTAEGADNYLTVLANTQTQLVYSSNAYNQSGTNYIVECFKRAPKFFDEVCYTGNGPGTQVVSHNLAAVPELVINKTRNATNGWTVFQGSTTALNGFLRLNTNAAQNTGDTLTVSSTTITADSTLGFGMNTSGTTYVTYLFATCPGVSKVGRYTGTGTTLQINCGFSAGSRFVMIKRIDSTGDWYVWDSARGIVAGNDPYLLINDTAAEVTGTDYVDTAATGFEITSTAPVGINASGGTYIFLAIA
jgi:hypothetical protein